MGRTPGAGVLRVGAGSHQQRRGQGEEWGELEGDHGHKGGHLLAGLQADPIFASYVTEPSRPSQTRATTEKRAALSRDLAEFLIEFSIALHKHAMYPGGHPTLAPAAGAVGTRLGNLMVERPTLSLGVARDQLVIDGVATDPKNMLLHDLAERLHKHHIGAVSFTRGIVQAELEEALRVLASDSEREGEPLGLRPAAQIPRWPHVELYPLTFERLELVGVPEEGEEAPAEVTGGRGAQLWVGLARAALAVDEMRKAQAALQLPPEPQAFRAGMEAPATPSDATADSAVGGAAGGEAAETSTEPAAVAKAIESHERGTAYDQVIVGYLLQIAEELKTAGAAGAAALQKKMSRLITTLDGRTLERLLEMCGDVGQRRKFVLDASQGMAVDAVVDIVKAATGTGAPISQAMLRMLSKLGQHAERGPAPRRAIAESALRDQVGELIKGWALADPNPDGYALALQKMSQSTSTLVAAEEVRFAPEAERIVQMAIETGAAGEPLERAVGWFVERGRIPDLIDMLEKSPRQSRATEAVRRRVVAPEPLKIALNAVPLDLMLVDRIAGALGAEAAEPMLQVLADSESRQVRSAIIARLVRMPDEVRPLLSKRLGDERWYVVRNMLCIAADLPGGPGDLDAAPFAQHADARVRREALRVLFRHPTERTRALCRALADPDEKVKRLAVSALSEGGVPDAAVPLLAAIATDHEADEELRVATVRSLAGGRSGMALDTLLKLSEVRRRSIMDRFSAQGTSPVLLAAVQSLAAFRNYARAKSRLEAVAHSRDPAAAKVAADVLGGAT